MILRRFEEALTAFQDAAVLRPDEPRVQFSLASVYGAMGRTLEAIDALREAIRLQPEMAEAHVALAGL